MKEITLKLCQHNLLFPALNMTLTPGEKIALKVKVICTRCHSQTSFNFKLSSWSLYHNANSILVLFKPLYTLKLLDRSYLLFFVSSLLIKWWWWTDSRQETNNHFHRADNNGTLPCHHSFRATHEGKSEDECFKYYIYDEAFFLN